MHYKKIYTVLVFSFCFLPIVSFSATDAKNVTTADLAEISHPVTGSFPVFKVDQDQLILDNTNVEKASLVVSESGHYGVEIKLKPAAATELSRIAKNAVGKRALIIFNEKIISETTIRSALGDDFVINGLEKEEAQMLVTMLD